MKSTFLLFFTVCLMISSLAQTPLASQGTTPITGKIQIYNANSFVVPDNTDISIRIKLNGITTVSVKKAAAGTGNQTMQKTGVRNVKIILGKDPSGSAAARFTSIILKNSDSQSYSKTTDANGWINISDLPPGTYSITVNGNQVVTNFKLAKISSDLKDSDNKSGN